MLWAMVSRAPIIISNLPGIPANLAAETIQQKPVFFCARNIILAHTKNTSAFRTTSAIVIVPTRQPQADKEHYRQETDFVTSREPNNNRTESGKGENNERGAAH